MARINGDMAFKGLMVLAALAATGSIAYYFVFLMPAVQQKQLELEAKVQEATTPKHTGDPEGLRSCLKIAADNYGIRWKNECYGKQLPENCDLPPDIANNIHTLNQAEVDTCLRQFE